MSVAAEPRPIDPAVRPEHSASGDSPRRSRRIGTVAPSLALAIVVGGFLALTLARRFDVVADELAAFGAGMRLFRRGPLEPNLIDQLFVNPYLVAALTKLVGVERSFVAARWAQAAFGLVTVIGTFELARRLTGRPWLAVLAAALLVASPFFIHSHHQLRMDNPETAGFTLTLLALLAWQGRPGPGRLVLVVAAAAFLVAGKLMGILFLPGLGAVALGWRLRQQGGHAFALGLVGALWLAWALPQTLVLRAGLSPETAQAIAFGLAVALVLLLIVAFRAPLAGLTGRPRLALAGAAAAGVLVTLVVFSPIGGDRQWAFRSLVQYQLQRFTIALDENHPGNQERFPEGYPWYLDRLAREGLGPPTLALAGAGVIALAIDRRRSPARRLLRRPGGGLLLLLPLVAGLAFLGGARSWFLRYTLPLFPILATLAALGAWELGGRLTRLASVWPGRRGAAIAARLAGAFAIALAIAVIGRNVLISREQNQIGEQRATFFELREAFGQRVRPGEIVLSDHADHWIYDSRVFLEPVGAYPLMMLGLPWDVTLMNVGFAGTVIADWLLTDRPVDAPGYELVYATDRPTPPWQLDPSVTRFFVYRNLYGRSPEEKVRLDLYDLLDVATVRGGNNPGLLLRWNFDAGRHLVVRSHPGDNEPNLITFPIEVQPGDRLLGRYGFDPEAAGVNSDGANVAIRIVAGGESRVVLTDDRVLPPAKSAECGPWNQEAVVCTPITALPKGGWKDFSIDLGEYAGRSIEVELETGPGPSGRGDFDWTGWADLRVVQ